MHQREREGRQVVRGKNKLLLGVVFLVTLRSRFLFLLLLLLFVWEVHTFLSSYWSCRFLRLAQGLNGSIDIWTTQHKSRLVRIEHVHCLWWSKWQNRKHQHPWPSSKFGNWRERKKSTNEASFVFPFPISLSLFSHLPWKSHSVFVLNRELMFPPTENLLSFGSISLLLLLSSSSCYLYLSMNERQLHRILPLERDLMVCVCVSI